MLVVLPQDHPLAGYDKFPVAELANSPFMLLEKGANAEIGEIITSHQVVLHVALKTWEDYAIMAMVESERGTVSHLRSNFT